MPNIGAPELIIIAVALVVLFGATKLPTFARSVGRSMRIFKSEVKGMQKDDDGDDAPEAEAKKSEETQQLTEAKKTSTESATTASQQSADQR